METESVSFDYRQVRRDKSKFAFINGLIWTLGAYVVTSRFRFVVQYSCCNVFENTIVVSSQTEVVSALSTGSNGKNNSTL